MALAAAAALLAGLATALVTVVTIYRLHVPLPYWDDWYTVIDFRQIAEGGYGWSDLVRQHNEHRLLFPRLVFIADDRLAAASGWLNISATLALQGLDAAILILLSRRLVARGDARILLAGLILALLFSLRQEQNFSNGFQNQFVGVFTSAALAGVAYASALERLRGGWRRSVPAFAAAALCCFVSTFTMANGVLAGPVLLGAALLRRAPWPVPLATAALSALLAAAFFDGYVPGGSSYGLHDALTHLPAYPRFVTAYLGNPLGSDIRVTQAFGSVGLLLAAGAAWRVAAGRSREPAALALVVLVWFVVATAAATAWGRIVGGTQGAFESRYATPALLFWAALVVFWFPAAFGRAARGGGRLLAVPMALLVGAAVASEASAIPVLAARSAALRRVSDSLLSGLWDRDAAATYETIEADDIAPFADFLRARRLAAFADPAFDTLGRRIDGEEPPSACRGEARATADPALGPGGVRLAGRAVDVRARRAPHRIVVADASGTVVGFGSASLPGEPSRLWTAYARAEPGAVLRVYARLADGGLCAIGAAPVEPAPRAP